jgi:hypothetical protein
LIINRKGRQERKVRAKIIFIPFAISLRTLRALRFYFIRDAKWVLKKENKNNFDVILCALCVSLCVLCDTKKINTVSQRAQ